MQTHNAQQSTASVQKEPSAPFISQTPPSSSSQTVQPAQHGFQITNQTQNRQKNLLILVIILGFLTLGIGAMLFLSAQDSDYAYSLSRSADFGSAQNQGNSAEQLEDQTQQLSDSGSNSAIHSDQQLTFPAQGGNTSDSTGTASTGGMQGANDSTARPTQPAQENEVINIRALERPLYLVGSWHASPWVPSAYVERFVFEANGGVYFFGSQYEKDSVTSRGIWGVKDGRLYIEFTGETAVGGSWLQLIPITPRIEQYTLGSLQPNTDSSYPYKISIGNETYVQYSSETEMWSEEYPK